MLRRWLRLLRLLWLLHGRVKLLLLLNGRRRMLLWLWWLLRCELMLQSVRLRRVGLLHRWLMSHRLDRLRLERRLQLLWLLWLKQLLLHHRLCGDRRRLLLLLEWGLEWLWK